MNTSLGFSNGWYTTKEGSYGALNVKQSRHTVLVDVRRGASSRPSGRNPLMMMMWKQRSCCSRRPQTGRHQIDWLDEPRCCRCCRRRRPDRPSRGTHRRRAAPRNAAFRWHRRILLAITVENVVNVKGFGHDCDSVKEKKMLVMWCVLNTNYSAKQHDGVMWCYIPEGSHLFILINWLHISCLKWAFDLLLSARRSTITRAQAVRQPIA